MMDGASASVPRSRAWLLLAAAVLTLAAAAAVGVWWATRHRPSPHADPDPAPAVDPRLDYPTPYKNVRPEVRYVGDWICADCHVKESQSYSHHPMGRALAPVA